MTGDETPATAPRALPRGPASAAGLRPRPRRRAADAAAPGRRASDAVVDCAVYVDGRAPGAGAAARTRCRWPTDAGRLRLARACYEPTEDELERDRRRATACTRWPSRTPSTPTSGPKLEHYDDALFMVLKTATVRGARAAHRDQRGGRHRRGHGLPRRALRDHRPARRARRADRAAAAAWRSSADLLCLGPSAVLYAVADLVVDTLRRRGRRGRGGRRRARGVGLQPRPHRRHRPALPAQARADAAAPGGLARWRCRCRSWPSGRSTSSRTRCAPTSATSWTTPSGSATRWARSTSCCRRSCRRPWPARRWPTTRTCARSRPGPRMIAVPTLITGVYGMNFGYMPELNWRYGYPMVLLLIVARLLAALPRLQAQRLAVARPHRCARSCAIPSALE